MGRESRAAAARLLRLARMVNGLPFGRQVAADFFVASK